MIHPKSPSKSRRCEPGHKYPLARFGESRNKAEKQEGSDRDCGPELDGEASRHGREEEAASRHQAAGAEAVRKPATRVGARAPDDVEAGPGQGHGGHGYSTVLQSQEQEGLRQAEEAEGGEGKDGGPES